MGANVLALTRDNWFANNSRKYNVTETPRRGVYLATGVLLFFFWLLCWQVGNRKPRLIGIFFPRNALRDDMVHHIVRYAISKDCVNSNHDSND